MRRFPNPESYTEHARERMSNLHISQEDVENVIATADDSHVISDPHQDGVYHIWRGDKHVVYKPSTRLVVHVALRTQGRTKQSSPPVTPKLPSRVRQCYEDELAEVRALLRGEVLECRITTRREAMVKQQRMRSRMNRCGRAFSYRHQGGVLYMSAW